MSVLKNRITAVLAGSALVVGLGATGAVAGNLIGSADIRDGGVHRVDLGDAVNARIDNKATGREVNGIADRVSSLEGEEPAIADVRADEPYVHTIGANSVGVAWAACPEAGQVALGGGFRLNGFAAEAFSGGGSAVPGVSAIASEPVGILDGAVVNTYQNEAFPQTERGSFEPNGWAVTVQNDSDQPQDVRVAVVCATVAD